MKKTVFSGFMSERILVFVDKIMECCAFELKHWSFAQKYIPQP